MPTLFTFKNTFKGMKMAVKISSLLPKKTEVDTGNGMLEVGSIDLVGITKLIRNFKEPLMALFSSGSSGKPDFAALSVSAPDMIIAIIALGADAEGQEEDIKKLPVGVQIIAAAEVWAQSVPDAKKLLSVLSMVLAQLKPSNQPIKEQANLTVSKQS